MADEFARILEQHMRDTGARKGPNGALVYPPGYVPAPRRQQTEADKTGISESKIRAWQSILLVLGVVILAVALGMAR